MKKIVFVRHAKSSWELDISDYKRPLSSRGFADVNLLSKEFKPYNFIPTNVFSSPAKRAITTCEIFMENLGLAKELLTIADVLYDFGGNQVLRFIKSMDNSMEKVMIFGHNNALTTLVNNLGDSSINNLPTAGLVMIDFDITRWEDIDQGCTKLILKPKDFK